MYSGAATPYTERIAQNECVDSRNGWICVHRNKKPGTEKVGEKGATDGGNAVSD